MNVNRIKVNYILLTSHKETIIRNKVLVIHNINQHAKHKIISDNVSQWNFKIEEVCSMFREKQDEPNDCSFRLYI